MMNDQYLKTTAQRKVQHWSEERRQHDLAREARKGSPARTPRHKTIRLVVALIGSIRR